MAPRCRRRHCCPAVLAPHVAAAWLCPLRPPQTHLSAQPLRRRHLVRVVLLAQLQKGFFNLQSGQGVEKEAGQPGRAAVRLKGVALPGTCAGKLPLRLYGCSPASPAMRFVLAQPPRAS